MSNSFLNPAPGAGSFLPEDYIARKSEFRANLIILTLFAVVLAGVVGAFLVTTTLWSNLRSRKEAVDIAIAEEQKKVEDIKRLESMRSVMMEKAQITAALSERIPRWALLGELLLRMPIDMRVETLTLKSKRVEVAPPPQPAGAGVKTLTGNATAAATSAEASKPKVLPPKFEYSLVIVGMAEQNNDIADYLSALRQSPILTLVELQYIREAKENDRVLRKFEINASLRGEVGTEALANSLKALAERRERKLAEIINVTPAKASNANDGASSSAAGAKEE